MVLFNTLFFFIYIILIKYKQFIIYFLLTLNIVYTNVYAKNKVINIPTIVTSIRPLGFIASAIAENLAEVDILIPDYASPHSYVLRPNDLMKLKKSHIFIWIGPELETFLSKLVMNAYINNKNIALSKMSNIRKYLLYNDDYCNLNSNKNIIHNNAHTYKKTYDMHIWLSPEIAQQIAFIIYDALLKLIPEKKVCLDFNLMIFNNSLQKHNKIIFNMLNIVRDKEYYVFHNAYKYFEKYYNISPSGYFTINPNLPLEIHNIYNIKTKLVTKKFIYIFYEPQFMPAIIKNFSKRKNVKLGILDPLGIGIPINKNSYFNFLLKLANQYTNCMQNIND